MTNFRSFLTGATTIIPHKIRDSMNPGIGLMKRRLPTEKEAIPLAISGLVKKYGVTVEQVKTLETKYDEDGGDLYVALGFKEKRAIVKMDSVQGTITEIKEI
ncbi:MAG: hypothetical protein ACREAG_03575 [Nitrosopumilaceae archaeon]